MLGKMEYRTAVILSETGDFPVLKSAIENRKEDPSYKNGDKTTHFFTCCNKEGKVVGVLGYEIMSEHSIYLSPLEVMKDYQGLGIATMLLKVMQNIAEELKCDLNLYCDETLVHFYEKLGFEVIKAMEDNAYEMYWRER